MKIFEKFMKNLGTGFTRLFVIITLINIGDGIYDLGKEPIWVSVIVLYAFIVLLGEI